MNRVARARDDGVDVDALDVTVERRRAQAVDAIPPSLLVAALVLAAAAPVHPVLEPGPASTAVGLVCGALAAVFAAARAALRWRWVRGFVRRRPHEVLLAACLLGSVAAASELVAFSRPTSAGGLVVFLLAAGVLTTQRRHALVVVAAVLTPWFVVAGVHSFAGAWAPMSVLVVCAAVLAHVLQVIRSRATDHLALAEALVMEAAVTDELTGLRNRRGLVAAGELLLHADPSVPFSAVYLDIDGLKRTNDELGHAAGDRLLRAVAAVLLRTARSGDVVARIGGDEFAVLLPGAGDDDARDTRRRLERALQDAGVPASLGSSSPVDHRGVDVSVPVLLAEADSAMYADKQRRREAPAVRPTTVAPRVPDLDRSAERVATDRLLAAPGIARTAGMDLLGLARVGSWLHLVLAPVHLLVLPTGPGRVMAGVSLAVAALLATVLLPRLRATVTRRAEVVLCGVMVVLCAQTIGYSALVTERWASLPTILALVTVGGTLAGSRRVAWVCGVTTLAWSVVELVRGLDAQTPAYAVPLVSGLGVAVLLHLVHHRTLARLSAAEERVRAVAMTDELTGLPNRRAFLTLGRPLVELLLRRGDQAAVLLLDLDGLKRVNDQQGHAAGDRLLATAADVLRRSVGPRDLLARLAGDEFTVLMHGCTPADVPSRIAWLDRALAAEGVSASIGVAHLPGDSQVLEGLVARADDAMLVVKRQRRRAGPPAVPVA